jgi:hypothetical protein
MAGVLILGLVGAGEVLARRNIGTAPLPDFIWFRRKNTSHRKVLLHLKNKKG